MKSATQAVLAIQLAIFGGLFLTGCSQQNANPADEPSGAPNSTASKATPPLDGTSWVLTQLPGQAAFTGEPATAQFTAGRVQGTDGCNRYSAPVTVTGSTLAVGPRGVSTQMGCPEDVMKRANAFMAALNGARSYRIAGGRLELLSSSGAVLAIMAAQSTSLIGTWEVTGINNGRQALVGVLGNPKIDMAFTADGKVAGSAGCNRFNAEFKASGDSLRFTPAATTRRMCSGEGVMEQEQIFVAAMSMVSTMRMDGNTLELRRPDGEMALLLRRVGN